MIQDEMDGNGLRTGVVTFRTETQRGPENTEELFLAVVGLIYLSTAHCLSRLRTEQRAKKGTASQFPAQRGYPEEGRQCKWESAGQGQREEAVLQPQSDSKTNKEGVVSET